MTNLRKSLGSKQPSLIPLESFFCPVLTKLFTFCQRDFKVCFDFPLLTLSSVVLLFSRVNEVLRMPSIASLTVISSLGEDRLPLLDRLDPPRPESRDSRKLSNIIIQSTSSEAALPPFIYSISNRFDPPERQILAVWEEMGSYSIYRIKRLSLPMTEFSTKLVRI